MMRPAREKYIYHNVISGKSNSGVIDVISETPVSMTVNGEIWLTFMCTPLDLEELAIGFLYNEGIINSAEEIASVRVCPQGDNVDIWLEHHVEIPHSWSKTSGCTGGITTINHYQTDILDPSAKGINGAVYNTRQISQLVSWFFESQELYKKAGGVHTSALSDGIEILIAAEDIGRHNTLDKIAGYCLLNAMDPDRKLIITTGRVSSEMLHKAARIGASLLISRTSPTTLSIELAEKYGITLIGYARRDRFKIYSYPERILVDGKVEKKADAR
jgi:FdhD protein